MKEQKASLSIAHYGKSNHNSITHKLTRFISDRRLTKCLEVLEGFGFRDDSAIFVLSSFCWEVR